MTITNYTNIIPGISFVSNNWRTLFRHIFTNSDIYKLFKKDLINFSGFLELSVDLMGSY